MCGWEPGSGPFGVFDGLGHNLVQVRATTGNERSRPEGVAIARVAARPRTVSSQSVGWGFCFWLGICSSPGPTFTVMRAPSLQGEPGQCTTAPTEAGVGLWQSETATSGGKKVWACCKAAATLG